MIEVTGRLAGMLSLMVVALCLGCNHDATTDSTKVQPPTAERRRVKSPDINELLHTLPMVAVWTESSRLSARSSLRVALWDDGRVLFAANDGALRFGQISHDTIRQLTHDIRKTNLFDLKGHCYLVPDAPVMCLLAILDGDKQHLYWDERVSPNYGININPKPHHRDFMNAWKSTNDLVIAAIPSESVPIEHEFRAPESWYIKRAIQSE